MAQILLLRQAGANRCSMEPLQGIAPHISGHRICRIASIGTPVFGQSETPHLCLILVLIGIPGQVEKVKCIAPQAILPSSTHGLLLFQQVLYQVWEKKDKKGSMTEGSLTLNIGYHQNPTKHISKLPIWSSLGIPLGIPPLLDEPHWIAVSVCHTTGAKSSKREINAACICILCICCIPGSNQVGIRICQNVATFTSSTAEVRVLFECTENTKLCHGQSPR